MSVQYNKIENKRNLSGINSNVLKRNVSEPRI
jgi:hypothetical protein